jgi:5-formyltetrahydrofolate cyclo-ligase
MNGKREIRKRVLGQRNLLSGEELASRSGEIIARLMRIEAIRSASTLMAYLSFGSEVAADDLIRWGWKEGKRIVVPFCPPEGREMTACRIDGFDELEKGRYGIRAPEAGRLRPVPSGEIDAVVVPAVAFDRRGYRVGYGGGYYDRFLPAATRAIRIGAAFACQIIKGIPVGPYDVKMDCIVTEEETIALSSRCLADEATPR